METSYRGQSYKWASYTISWDGDSVPTEFKNVRLSSLQSGNNTKIFVAPGGAWHGVYCRRDGEFSVSKYSEAESIIALASSGSWSGGGCYSGYIFGKAGAIVRFTKKSSQAWLVFSNDGCHWTETNPREVPIDL